MCASYLFLWFSFSSNLLIPVNKDLARLNKLAMSVPHLKQSTHLAEKQEAMRQQLQSEPDQPSKGKGKGNFYFMINCVILALLVLFLLDVYLQSIGSLSGKRSHTDTHMQPELKVQRLQVVTSPQKVTQQLVEGNYRCFDSV